MMETTNESKLFLIRGDERVYIGDMHDIDAYRDSMQLVVWDISFIPSVAVEDFINKSEYVRFDVETSDGILCQNMIEGVVLEATHNIGDFSCTTIKIKE
ncbi:MAG: hypothetical protein GY738_00100 [Pseudoalteromonas sp.]|nr:hypothetical protein [Pseudoalteromonas sp.]